MEDLFAHYCRFAEEHGAAHALIISVEEVAVAEWVRLKCQYGCGAYGRRLTCPPYSPTPDTTRKMLSEYSTALLMKFERISREDEVDSSTSRRIRELVYELEKRIFFDGFYKAFGMGAGPCPLCDVCDVGGRCEFPRKARPSMEACGIDVFATARNCGLALEVVRPSHEFCSYLALILIE
jgi:predicted metal-binding protein